MELSSIYSLYNKANEILASNISWDAKYDLIFSDEISRQTNFEWCDPDMDYEDDIRAFMRGFDRYMSDLGESAYISAYDARKKSLSNAANLESIMQKIREAVDSGHYHVELEDELDISQRNKLENMGYTISGGSTIIKW